MASYTSLSCPHGYGRRDWNSEHGTMLAMLWHYEMRDRRVRLLLSATENQLRCDEDRHLGEQLVNMGVVPPQPEGESLLQLRADRGIPATFRAWGTFFPAFPVTLKFVFLGAGSSQELTQERILSHPDRTRLMREWEEQWAQHREQYGAGERPRPLAVIFRWARLNAARCLVLHNVLPVRHEVPGMHCVWTPRKAKGKKSKTKTQPQQTLVLEDFATFLASLDAQYADETWAPSAIHANWNDKVD